MFRRVKSATIYGLDAQIVSVEVDVGNGLPIFEMSGYLAGEVKESKERIKVAIRNSGYELKPQRIVVNISPADIRKDGTGFDLPIAAGILSANCIIDEDRLEGVFVIGELSLDGSVNPITGILPMVCVAAESGFNTCIVPEANVKEAAMVAGIKVIGVDSLKAFIDIINDLSDYEGYVKNIKDWSYDTKHLCYEVDFSDVSGQEAAKRATLIAAAGMHNILYVGAPGSGKTMLAKRIPTIMPELSYEESMELTKIYSVAGKLNKNTPLITDRPFRSPHHNITSAGLLGGGRIPKPGEITLAGKGVLFLDEMTEFGISVIESLRQPLEDKKVTIVRLNSSFTYPADCMLAAAINPCKCGYYPDRKRCRCTEQEIQRYIGRISQPVWDRFDISVHVQKVAFNDIADGVENNNDNIYTSHNMQKMLEIARKMQKERFNNSVINYNSEMKAADIKKYCPLEKEERNLMEKAYERLNLTGRGYHKILKMARTIADLEESERIRKEHLLEAVSYRSFEGR